MGLVAFVLCGFGVFLMSVAETGRIAAIGMGLFFAGIVLGTWVGATH
jgi:hypothetical protein